MPKTLRVNATLYFILKILNKRELQQMTPIHSPDIDFKDFMELYEDYLKNNIYF